MSTLVESMLRFAINFAIVFVIVRFIYYPQRREKDYVFTFFAFNTIIFFVMGLLNNVDLGVGVGFGLFAIFSVLRYRTNTIPIREMTYLFVLIALPVVNSILLEEHSYEEFAVANASVTGVSSCSSASGAVSTRRAKSSHTSGSRWSGPRTGLCCWTICKPVRAWSFTALKSAG